MGIAVDAYDVYGAYKKTRATALAKAFAKGAFAGGNSSTSAGAPQSTPATTNPSVSSVELPYPPAPAPPGPP
jgi:hypothetical protein